MSANIEHYYGEFEGRETVYEWISSTMGKWPSPI